MAFVLATGKLWFRVPRTLRLILNGQLGTGVTSKDVMLHVVHRLGVGGALYRALEFAGPVIENMSLDSRMTITNMVELLGAKNGVLEPDERAVGYVEGRTSRSFEVLASDLNAAYEDVLEFELSSLVPQVAEPHSPANVVPVLEAEGVRVDQAFIGGCTNGRIEDLGMAAQILEGREVHRGVRLIIIPASQEIYGQAMERGFLRVLLDAGAVICAPSCGPCVGIDKGILASGEVCISSTNKNYRGRMGHVDSKVYLGSAATVAASAVEGKIADPRRFL
jgi:homoaconitase/3-isopropylmalate dehydratase large subunit